MLQCLSLYSDVEGPSSQLGLLVSGKWYTGFRTGHSWYLSVSSSLLSSPPPFGSLTFILVSSFVCFIRKRL